MSYRGETTDAITFLPLKRLDGLTGPRRARAACNLCRWRKVRCNAQNEEPCSNCTFENVQCVKAPKQRRRREAAKTSAKSQNSLVASSSSTTIIEQPRRRTHEALSLIEPVDNRSYPELQSTVTRIRLNDSDSHSAHDQDDEIDWPAAAVQSVPLPISPKPPSCGSPNETFSDLTSSSSDSSIPSFLKMIPSYLAKEDVDYLYRKGALSVPEPELRDAIIESYFHYIHPCLPLLDFGPFADSVRGTSKARISFPLFQAVMFAGAAWVDVKLLRRLGFLTRKAARKSFYLKARLLYDADYEQDRLCIVQTLLLLSLWWEGPHEQKDGWHWSGLSLSVARTIGLHRDINNQQVSPEKRGLRRRLWWCCTMRDTIASIGTNRPPRVRDHDFEVAPLTLDDFEFEGFRSKNIPEHRYQDLIVQKQLATICIQMASICRIIGRVLQSAYIETQMGNIDTLYFSSSPKPGRILMNPREFGGFEEDFRHWKDNLPLEVLHTSPTPAPSLQCEQAPLLHRAMVSMLYHTGVIMLHRQRTASGNEEMVDEQGSSLVPEDTSRTIVREAAIQVNRIVMDIYQADLMKFLPATGISCLFPVSISHVFDMKSGDPVIRREGHHRLEECKQALRELVDTHIAAEWAVNLLTYVESRVNAPTRASGNLLRTTNRELHRTSAPRVSESNHVQNQTQDASPIQDVDIRNSARDLTVRILESAPHSSTTLQEDSSQMNGTFHESTGTSYAFPDFINFPQLWLNSAEVQGNTLEMNWMGTDDMTMIYG